MSVVRERHQERPLGKLTDDELRVLDDVGRALSGIGDSRVVETLAGLCELAGAEWADRDLERQIDKWGPERIEHFTVEALRPGIEWLTSEQADDAVVTQFGISTHMGPYRVSVTPGGSAQGMGSSVVIVELRSDAQVRRRQGIGTVRNGIDLPEREALEAVLAELAPVCDRWNGESSSHTSCSFAIDTTVGEGVRRAYANYGAARGGGKRVKIEAPEGWQ